VCRAIANQARSGKHSCWKDRMWSVLDEYNERLGPRSRLESTAGEALKVLAPTVWEQDFGDNYEPRHQEGLEALWTIFQWVKSEGGQPLRDRLTLIGALIGSKALVVGIETWATSDPTRHPNRGEGWPQPDTAMLGAAHLALAELAALGLVGRLTGEAAMRALLAIPTPTTPDGCSAWLSALGAIGHSETNSALTNQSAWAKVVEVTAGAIGLDGWEAFTCEACRTLKAMGRLMELKDPEHRSSLKALILRIRKRNGPLILATAQIESLLHLCETTGHCATGEA
jgi:hypothetical protein